MKTVYVLEWVFDDDYECEKGILGVFESAMSAEEAGNKWLECTSDCMSFEVTECKLGEIIK